MAAKSSFMLYPQLMDICPLQLVPLRSNHFRSSFGMLPKSLVMIWLLGTYKNDDEVHSHSDGLLIKSSISIFPHSDIKVQNLCSDSAGIFI